jgi:hypothetical protein
LCSAEKRFNIATLISATSSLCWGPMTPHLQSLVKSRLKRYLTLMSAASALLALGVTTAKAQDVHSAPCVTSVVLRDCPDRLATPFQTEAERTEAAERQRMQDQFATTDQLRQRRAAQGESDLDRITVYGSQLAPATPALVQFGQTVNKSSPKDCRNAYTMSGAKNRFGVYDLLHDTFTGKPCSWH